MAPAALAVADDYQVLLALSEADYVTFTSSSTVRFWCEAVGERVSESRFRVLDGPWVGH